MQRLPLDTWDIVLSYLRFLDLVSVAAVSKELRSIAHNRSRKASKQFLLDEVFNCTNSKEILKELKRAKKQIVVWNCKSSRIKDLNTITVRNIRQGFREICHHLRKILETINIPEEYKPTTTPKCKRCPKDSWYLGLCEYHAITLAKTSDLFAFALYKRIHQLVTSTVHMVAPQEDWYNVLMAPLMDYDLDLLEVQYPNFMRGFNVSDSLFACRIEDLEGGTVLGLGLFIATINEKFVEGKSVNKKCIIS